jgi:hypothetical protein
MSASEKLKALGDRAARDPLKVDVSDYSDIYVLGFLAGQANARDAFALPQIVAVVEDGENAIEQAILFVERHIKEDHAKPLLAVLRMALARFAALDEALS